MGHRRARQPGERPRLDPGLLARPEVRALLARHDIGALFRVLREHGWTQRQIAEATGTPQSSVCEIVNGRRVIGFPVLVRIADGLGIPRELMRLWPDESGAYADLTELSEEVIAEMRRRALIANAGLAFAGRQLRGIGEPAKLPRPSPVPLPSRIQPVHVAQVRDLTQSLRDSGRAYGWDPAMSSAAAERANRLLTVSGSESVTHALRTAVAELHLLAGWAAFDAGLYNHAMYHYNCGLELAIKVGDAYLQAKALSYAGLATEEHGYPNDGLKMLQFGQLKAADIPSDEQRESVLGVSTRVAVEACLRADSATAFEHLGHPRTADAQLAESRELWLPGPADQAGDLDAVAARLLLARGRLDAAEPFAVASLRRWETGTSQRVRAAHAGILLATIHVRAGEPGGWRLAHSAITDVGQLSSTRARRHLNPLITALEAQPGTDHRQLARMARHIAATQT